MERGKRRFAVGFLIGCFVLAGATPLASLAYSRFEPAAWFHDVVGADVSHHQGPIDWAALEQDGIDFVYMKATEGGDFKDTLFPVNWRESSKVGLPRGAYHFFTLCRSGDVQAANFIDTVPVDPTALPHAVDAEHMGPCRSGLAMADVAREIEIFIERLEKHYGRRPIIYTTTAFYDAHLHGKLVDERYWLRSLVLPPSYGPDHWAIWQYHNFGRRDGVSGPLDLNVFSGSVDQFSEFAGNVP